ncbi:MAG: UDP-N-acetylmuramoyl-L-alanine--D-glutamate ligase [Eubacteriales bacterium]|nr:UDP-N-acetylmuramoyl-L-alanine--D-glutamate ligase [Eubacteriales bacterium]
MDYQGKTALVVGLARSGVAAAKLLSRLGARVIANDTKDMTQLPAARELSAVPGIWLEPGRPAMELLGECDILVLSPGISAEAGFVREAVRQGKEVVGELELGAGLTDKPILAITGTNGKTTCTSLAGMMMRMSGNRVGIVGNIGDPLCDHVCLPDEEDLYVAEVSSFQLETVQAFRPRVSALLNITPDHLDRHHTMENYIDTKCRIFAQQRAGDVAVLNYDDEALRAVAHLVPCKLAWFSRRAEVDEGCFVRDGRIVFRTDGQEQTLCRSEEVRIPGAHNLENALAAAACALYAGASAKAVRHSLAAFEGVEHRLELVEKIRGVRFINDSKGTNPDASIKAIQAMTLPTVLIAGGYDKKTGFDSLAQALPGSKIVGLVVLGQTAGAIQAAAQAAGFTDIAQADSLENAVRLAYDMAHTGYNVLLSPACASFDMFTDYEERGRIFKQIVADLAKVKG